MTRTKSTNSTNEVVIISHAACKVLRAMFTLFVTSWTVSGNNGLRADRLFVCDKTHQRSRRRSGVRYRYRVSVQATSDEDPSANAGSAGNDDKTDAASSAAWAAWSRARQKPEDAASNASPRDPIAEVNFWRAAARESTEGVSESGNGADIGASGGDTLSEQRTVWGEAREVTADVEDLKERLADELKQYDPNTALDDYRSVAREIRNGGKSGFGASSPSPASPPPRPRAMDPPPMYPRAPPGGFATYGPDVVLDDFDPNEAPRDPKAETDFWRAAAREVVADVPPVSDSGSSASSSENDFGSRPNFTNTDAGASASTEDAFTQSGSFSSGDSNAEATTRRDPKAEIDFWRTAAREMVTDSANADSSDTSASTNTNVERLENTGVNFMTDETVFAKRDRVAETELWRAAAREVGDASEEQLESEPEVLPKGDIEVESETEEEEYTATTQATTRSEAGYPPLDGTEEYTMSGPGFSSSQIESGKDEGESTNANASTLFAAFRAADEQWSTSLGLEEEDNNETRRWQVWENTKGNTRSSEVIRGGLGDDTSLWMQAAREVSGDIKSEDEFKDDTKNSVSGNTDMWASAAREITEGLSIISDENENENEEDKEGNK